MLPPRAESVRGGVVRPRVPSTRYREPHGETLTSECKPADGLWRRRKIWTGEEIELATRLIAEKQPDSVFRKHLGRSKKQAMQRIIYRPERRDYNQP